MDSEYKEQLKSTIVEEIENQKSLIKSLEGTVQPVAPDNAIGRLTRMEAINSKSINEASLNSAKFKLENMEKALANIDDPDFGMCRSCWEPIPPQRILLMPESLLCVACAEKR